MQKFPVALIILLLSEHVLSEFDPKTFNCKTCTFACNCLDEEAKNAEIVDSIVEFRKQVVFTLNSLRNWLASGHKGLAPTAANMMLVNYDLEMEYIARCKGRQNNELPDLAPTCTPSNGISTYGSSLTADAHSIQMDTEEKFLVHLFEKTYDDTVTFLNDNEMIKHQQQIRIMLSGPINKVGCARLKNDSSSIFLYCMYQGDSSFEIPEPPNPVYEEGEKCSACPGNITCGVVKSFAALCGEAFPVPTTIIMLPGNEESELTAAPIEGSHSWGPTTVDSKTHPDSTGGAHFRNRKNSCMLTGFMLSIIVVCKNLCI